MRNEFTLWIFVQTALSPQARLHCPTLVAVHKAPKYGASPKVRFRTKFERTSLSAQCEVPTVSEAPCL